MGIAPEKPDHPLLDVDGDAIAIVIGKRRGDDRPHGNIRELADPLKNISHLPPFDGELMFVSDMLVAAAAASAQTPGGCVLPVVDAPPPPVQTVEAVPPPPVEGGGGISPLFIALLAIAAGIGIFLAVNDSGNANSPA